MNIEQKHMQYSTGANRTPLGPKFSCFLKDENRFSCFQKEENKELGQKGDTKEDRNQDKRQNDQPPAWGYGKNNKNGSNGPRQCTRPICYRCRGVGHVAASSAFPENGKKPTQAQIHAAHTIIMDAVDGIEDDNGMNRDSNSSGIASSELEFKMMEFKKYPGSSGGEQTDPGTMRSTEHVHAMIEHC